MTAVDAAPLAASAAAALAAVAALTAAGTRLRRLLGVPLPPGLRWPVDLSLGAAVLSLGVLALGLAGALDRRALAVLLLAVVAAGRWRPFPRPHLAAAPALGGLAALVVAARPPFFYDALVYHLALPWQALLEGGFAAHRESLFAAFPPLAQCLYAPPLAFGLDRAPALLHWIAFVAAGAAVAALARGLGASRLLAALAGAAVPLLPSHVLVAGFPAAEGWMLAPAAAAYALLLRRRVHPSWPLLAGTLAGIACAARVQALPWAAGAVVLALVRSRRATRGATRGAALAAAGCALGALPWWLKNLVLLGEPLAPLGWRREGIETLWRDGGTALLLQPDVGALLAHARAALLPVAPWLAALALAAALAAAQWRDRRHAWTLAAAGAGVLVWCTLASLPRFLALPAMLLAELGRATSHPEGVIVNDPSAAFAAAAALPRDARVLFVGEPRGFAFPRRFVAPSQHDVSPLREPAESATGAPALRSLLRERGFTHLLVNRRELGRLITAYPVAPWRTEAGRVRFAELLQLLGPPVVAAGGVEIYALGLAPG